MFEKLAELERRLASILDEMSAPGLKPSEMSSLNKERTQLEPIVEAFCALRAAKVEREGNLELLAETDPEMKEMARAEISRLDGEIEVLEENLKLSLLPKDPDDQKNVIIEIRGGTGGDEAALFAGELFQMYARFADRMRWKVEVMNTSEGSRGGYKEVVASVTGDQVFAWLKFEAGVHRVQRVPDTETQGRIHTSACTVAILPEAEEVDIQIEDKDIRIDVFRAGGPGGQSVNTTDSAVRITHIPTGVVVQCQDEKSQLKNKAKAMKVLRARLYEAERLRLEQERSQERKAMVKSGDRSDKIRTYNFPQDRCTDHRIGLTVHNLPKLFAGDMQEMLSQVRAHFQSEQLRAQSQGQ